MATSRLFESTGRPAAVHYWFTRTYSAKNGSFFFLVTTTGKPAVPNRNNHISRPILQSLPKAFTVPYMSALPSALVWFDIPAAILSVLIIFLSLVGHAWYLFKSLPSRPLFSAAGLTPDVRLYVDSFSLPISSREPEQLFIPAPTRKPGTLYLSQLNTCAIPYVCRVLFSFAF